MEYLTSDITLPFFKTEINAGFLAEISRDFLDFCRIKRRFILGQYYLANEWEYFPEKTFYSGDVTEEQEKAFKRCIDPNKRGLKQ